MSYRIGILGAGNISETHARAASEIPGVEIVAVWGGNAGRAARLAERHGAVAYAELERFLAHRPLDVVLVGSPSGLHAEHARAAARHGLHVLVEKPLDVTTARVDDLIAECQRAGVKLGVFFQERAAPDIQWLRRFVAAGGLGRIILASARVRWFRPPDYYAGSRWRGTWALDGGGALMNQGIHTVDLLVWLLGEPTRVFARASTMLHDIEVEDTAVACLEFASGALATLETTTAAYPGFPRRLELTGSEGTVILEGNNVVSLELRTRGHEPPPSSVGGTARADGTASGIGVAVALGPGGAGGGAASQAERAASATVSDTSGHRAVLEDFLRAIETGARPLCDGHDARLSITTVEAIYRSARDGTLVRLGPA